MTIAGTDQPRESSDGSPAPSADAEARALWSRPDRAGSGRIALALFVLFSATYAYFQPATQWNENSRFDLTRSLVERGRLDIDPYQVNTEDKARYRGHYFSDKAPGASFLGAVGYGVFYGVRRIAGKALPKQWVRRPAGWISQRSGRKMPFPSMGYNPAFRRGLAFANLTANVLPAALAMALLFLLLVRRFGRDPVQALFAVLAYGLASLAFPYATLFYGHQLAASCLILAWAVWELWRERSGFLRGATTGFLLSWAVVTEYTVAPVAVLLGLWMSWSGSLRLRALAGLLAGALPAGLLLGAYHWACFGSPFSVGYQHLVDPVFAKGMSQGLMGVRSPDPKVALALLFGPHRGIFFQTPVFALAFVGLWFWWKDGPRALVALVGFFFLYYWLLNASYYMWDGGAALGPRHMIPGLGLLAAGMAWAYPLERGPVPRAAKLAAWVAFAWSAANMLAASAVGPEAPLDVFDPLADYVWPHFLTGHLAYTQGSSNFGLLLGLPGLWSLAPLGLLWLLGGVWLWNLIKTGRRPS